MQLSDNSEMRQHAANSGGTTLADNSDMRDHFVGDTRVPTLDASVDPYAGETADNGKEIWTPEHAAENLNRTGANWHIDNGGVAEDGVLTYSFWTSLDQLEHSYYVTPDGSIAFNEAYYGDDFSAFNADQIHAAEQALQSWDDLISLSFERVDDPNNADLNYGMTDTGPASQAYAYLPYGDATYGVYDDYYGFEDAYKLGGDVWTNNTLASNYSPLGYGSYAEFTLIHETGHAIGLSHGGDYNAGQGTPITYEDSAYFYQDSNQYTVMSYFGAEVTGAGWVDWQQVVFGNAMTPMVHDVLAVQNMYGADMTTRVGDTTYGFNSNAGRDYFDFDLTPSPIVTIWDADGNDTLDFSGFATDEIINLNQGAFSSASEGASLEYLKSVGFLPDNYTQAQLEALFASYGNGSQGQMYDNIAIAYGAVIENAIAGSGDDLLIANEVANVLTGNAGNDTVSYRDSDAGISASLTTNSGTRGDAAGDTYHTIENLEGSNYGDTFVGNELSQTLSGLAGNDTIAGLVGDDVIYGGDGNDRLFGNGGNDLLDGGAGADVLDGGAGFDTVSYRDAEARVALSLTNGTGTAGDAAGDSYSGIESVVGSAFSDAIVGGNGAEVLNGLAGDDTMVGLAGNDVLLGGAGNDQLYGNGGVDLFEGGAGADHIDGGAQVDTISFAGSSAGVTVSLVNGTGSGGDAEGDTYVSIENVEGSLHDDVVAGSDASQTLSGLAGNDTIVGLGGNDMIYGGDGADQLSGNGGNDWLFGGTGDDVLMGGSGNDVFAFSNIGDADVIDDFAHGQDKIDLSAIDAIDGTAANDGFTFIGAQGFHSTAGEVRVFLSGATEFLQGDVNGDGTADFSIELHGQPIITPTDLILG